MAFEQKDNSGAIFKNDKREKDSHPHAKGTARIDGVDYWISAWTKDDKHGGKYQSLSFKRKDQPGEVVTRTPAPTRGGGSLAEDLNDDVPFGPEWR